MPRRLVLALIKAYQLTVGRLIGGNCRFHPSCSEYAALAVRMNGAFIGSAQALGRIVRCGPWSRGGVDYPTPRSRAARAGGVAENSRG